MVRQELPQLLAERGVTRREAEVLGALAERLTNAEIAGRLYLSERTVESHVTSLLRKLGVRNRVALGDLARATPARPAGEPRLPAALELLADAGPFVGRGAELARLRKLWVRAAGGRMLMGVLAGPAGIGKSRLVAELAREVLGSGAQVRYGSCVDGVPAPYQPFVQALGAGVGGSRADVLDGLHTRLRREADAAPVLLVVDDAQWATSTTLGALRYLARLSGHAPVLTLVTTRDTSPRPESTTDLAELVRLPSVEWIDVAPLAECEVAELLCGLGVAADAAVVRAETGGSPLFVRELARPGAGIQDAVTGQLHVLDVAAAVGLEFAAELVAAVHGSPLDQVLESIERAESAGLVLRATDRPGVFVFSHALLRAARYDALPPVRQRELHRRIAAVLGYRAGDDGSLAALAWHVSMAGDEGVEALGGATVDDGAGQALRLSGDRAMALDDYAVAARAYEGAVRLWPHDDPQRPALLLDWGTALVTAHGRGYDVLTQARDGLLALGDGERAAAAELKLGELDWMSSRWDSCLGHLYQAAHLIALLPPSARTAQVHADLARSYVVAGDNRLALMQSELALDHARTVGRRDIEAAVLISIGPARVQLGDLGGVEDIRAGLEIARQLNSPETGRAYDNLSYVDDLLGRRKQCQQWRARAREVYERFGMVNNLRWVRAHDIEDRYLDGFWDAALADAESFLAETESSSHFRVTVCLRVRAIIRMARGNRLGGLADGAAAVEYARALRHRSGRLSALSRYARCLLESGRAGDASAVFSEIVETAAGHENVFEPVETAIVALGLGRETELLRLSERVTIPSTRWEIGRAVALGNLSLGADLYADLGNRTNEAYLRLLAAERNGAGRNSDNGGGADLRQARDFYRSVGAEAYLRRLDGVARGA